MAGESSRLSGVEVIEYPVPLFVHNTFIEVQNRWKRRREETSHETTCSERQPPNKNEGVASL